jgi:hypothetical protein
MQNQHEPNPTVITSNPELFAEIYYYYYYLLVLQPYVRLGLLHGFVTVDFSGVGFVSTTPKPQPGGPGTTLRLAPTL